MRVYKVRVYQDPEGWGFVLEVFPIRAGGFDLARRTLFPNAARLRQRLNDGFGLSNAEYNDMMRGIELLPFCEKQVALTDEAVVAIWGKVFD